MDEIFHSNSEALPRPNDCTLTAAANAQWQPSGTEGFWIKPLFEDEKTAQRTWLMQVDPGASAPSHSHTALEQIFVLEGSFFDQDRSYRAGDFVIRAPGAMHTAASKDGAVMLVIYT